MAGSSNATCFTPKAEKPTPPLIQDGQFRFQAHQIGWIICGFFSLVAVGVSAWLINKHLTHYTNKGQQRYIVRCLLLVPIYACVSTLSFILYDSYASPILLMRDAYESIVLHAFFWLLLEYISHDPEEQKEAFREIKLEKWMFPLQGIRRKPSGLFFLQIMKWGVLQYAVLRPVCTIAALLLNWFGLYCEISWSPGWGHVYLVVILSLSVSVAMYCLIQLYMPIADRLKPYNPLLKFVSVKAVVFFTFWQTTLLGLLATFNIVKDTQYMTANQINIGFAAILETFEMMVFAFLHIKAFSYLPYRPDDKENFVPTNKWRSFGHAMDFRDLPRQLWASLVYLFKRIRGLEPDSNERLSHLQAALGHRRIRGPGEKKPAYDPVEFYDGKESIETRPEPQHRWLHIPQTDLSSAYAGDPLEESINTELRRLRVRSEWERKNGKRHRKQSSHHRRDGALSETSFQDGIPLRQPPPQQGRSFWRGLYDRVSGGGGHHAVSQVEEEFGEDGFEGLPFRNLHEPTLHAKSALGISEPGPMVVISRGPLRQEMQPQGEREPIVLGTPEPSRSPGPPPPPPKHGEEQALGVQHDPFAPARADSFMKRVFTSDVMSSEDGYVRSRSHSQEMLGQLGGPLANIHIAESPPRPQISIKTTPQASPTGYHPQSEPHPAQLSLPIASPAVPALYEQLTSPVRSAYGSIYNPSQSSGSSSAGGPNQTFNGPRTRPSSGPVMPNPLSPARYPAPQRIDTAAASSSRQQPTIISPAFLASANTSSRGAMSPILEDQSRYPALPSPDSDPLAFAALPDMYSPAPARTRPRRSSGGRSGSGRRNSTGDKERGYFPTDAIPMSVGASQQRRPWEMQPPKGALQPLPPGSRPRYG